MKIKILPQAEQDLIDGFHFYEMQQAGLGGYFLNTLFSDIESLEFFAGAHPVVFKQYRCFPNDSHSPCTTKWPTEPFKYMQSSTAAEIRHGFTNA